MFSNAIETVKSFTIPIKFIARHFSIGDSLTQVEVVNDNKDPKKKKQKAKIKETDKALVESSPSSQAGNVYLQQNELERKTKL